MYIATRGPGAPDGRGDRVDILVRRVVSVFELVLRRKSGLLTAIAPCASCESANKRGTSVPECSSSSSVISMSCRTEAVSEKKLPLEAQFFIEATLGSIAPYVMGSDRVSSSEFVQDWVNQSSGAEDLTFIQEGLLGLPGLVDSMLSFASSFLALSDRFVPFLLRRRCARRFQPFRLLLWMLVREGSSAMVPDGCCSNE